MKKNNTNTNNKREAEVIDITEIIKKRKLGNLKNKIMIPDEQAPVVGDLSELIELMELVTDDIAGTLVARHVYNVDLLPGITSKDLMEELKIRIAHHTKLLSDIGAKLND